MGVTNIEFVRGQGRGGRRRREGRRNLSYTNQGRRPIRNSSFQDENYIEPW